jgi:replicative DNA helicase
VKRYLLPHSEEAEVGCLSAMMHGAVAPAFETIGRNSGEWFAHPVNENIYGALVDWWEAGKTFDLGLFTEALRDSRQLAGMGGPGRIAEIYGFSVPSMLPMYLESLAEKRWLRFVVTECGSAVKLAQEQQDDVAGILEQTEAMLMKLVGRHVSVEKRRDIRSIIADVIHDLSDREKTLGIPTGWPKTDALIGGLAPTHKVVIGGATSGGKSALAQCIVNSVAVDRNIPTALFTFEMNEQQAAQRIIQIRSGVCTRSVADGTADVFAMDAYSRAAQEIARAPLHIMQEQTDIAGIRSRCMQIKPRIIVIDYLQIVPEGWRKGEGTTERLDRMSNATKQLAQQLHATVIELTQLTVNDKTGKITTRFSAGITNDANELLILEGEDDETRPVIAKTLTVAKNRDGARGQVVFNFTRNITRFDEAK